MAGALVALVLGVGWVGNGDLFLSFRCRPGVLGGLEMVARSLDEFLVHFVFRYFSFICCR